MVVKHITKFQPSHNVDKTLCAHWEASSVHSTPTHCCQCCVRQIHLHSQQDIGLVADLGFTVEPGVHALVTIGLSEVGTRRGKYAVKACELYDVVCSSNVMPMY